MGTDHDKTDRERELDEFWSIDALLPRKKSTPSRHSASTDAVEITADPPGNDSDRESPGHGKLTGIADAGGEHLVKRFVPPHTAEEEEKKELPERTLTMQNSLIHSVRIYRWRTKYTYYDQFYRDGTRLYALRGVPCEPVSFFSYVPQYAQMNSAQLSWYLYWRDCVRHGQYPRTDSSYILLYIFELINFSDRISPEQTQSLLCRLWLSYYKDHPHLSHYMSEWLCDFGLLNGLPAPSCVITQDNGTLVSDCSLHEYYVDCSDASNPDGGYIRSLLTSCTNYNYKKSKFYNEKNAPLYDRIIAGTLAAVFGELTNKNMSVPNMKDITFVRDTFVGALCAEKYKKRLEIGTYSFSRSHELRFLVTDLIKYTENRIRESLGIKSRLSVFDLQEAIKQMADAYLLTALPAPVPVRKKEEEPPAYEKLYDLPRTPISSEHAAQIEAASWETTRRLVESFAENEEEKEKEETNDHGDETCGTTNGAHDSLNPQLPEIPATAVYTGGDAPAGAGKMNAASASPFASGSSYLRLLLDGKPLEASAYARAHGKKMEDALVDDLNSIALDLPEIGDIIIEECNNGYAVVPDYRDLLTEILEDTHE